MLRRTRVLIALLFGLLALRARRAIAAGADAGDAILESIVRTVVPLLAGLVITGLITIGWAPDDTQQQNLLAQISAVLTVIITALYYAVVRFLETHVSPKFGWLLGLAKQPTYQQGAAPYDGDPVNVLPPAGDDGQDVDDIEGAGK